MSVLQKSSSFPSDTSIVYTGGGYAGFWVSTVCANTAAGGDAGKEGA